MKAVMQFPDVIIHGFKAERFMGEHLRDVNPFTTPLNFAIVTDLSHDELRSVLNGRQFSWVGSWRTAIRTAGGLSSERLMRALPVVLFSIRIIGALLRPTIGLRRHGFFKRSMHALVTAVLRRLAWPDSLGSDTKANPPLREFTDPAYGQRRKGHSVIGADRLRQPIFSKHPLKPGFDRWVARTLQSLAQKQVARKIICDGQRVTTPSVAHLEISLEIGTPGLIGPDTLAKGLAIRSDSSPVNSGMNQSRTPENLTGRRVGWPIPCRLLLAQTVQHLLWTPLLMTQLFLHNHRPQFLDDLVGMTVRRTRHIPKSLRTSLLVALNPLVRRWPTDLINPSQFTDGVITTHPICDKLNSLIHDTGFLPRHRQSPPLPIHCKPCARFVL